MVLKFQVPKRPVVWMAARLADDVGMARGINSYARVATCQDSIGPD